MGTRWESVLLTASEGSVRELPMSVLALVDHVSPAIRVTLSAFQAPSSPSVWSLELCGVNKNPLGMGTLPPNVAAVLDVCKLPPDLSHRCRTSAVFALAVVASEQLGAATWVFHSDGTCESAALRLIRGAIERWSYSTPATHPDAYGHAAVTGIKELLTDVEYIDDLLDSMYSDEARCLAWRLMDHRQRVDPPTPLP